MEYVNELDTISAGAAKDAALKVHRLTFMEATMMVVGSTIGSAYVACRSRLFFCHFHALRS